MFSPNTKIYAPDGYVKIRKLKINDKIIILDGIRMCVGTVKFRQKIQIHRDRIIKLQFEGSDKKIICSQDEIFYDIQDQPLYASQIEIGEFVKGLHHNHHKLIGRETIEHDNQLSKLEKAGHHEFFLYNLLLMDSKTNQYVKRFYLNSGVLTKGLEFTEVEKLMSPEESAYHNYMEEKS